MNTTLEEILSAKKRFYKHVTVLDEDSCWPYSGYTNRDGYGSFKFQTAMVGAHVYARALKLGHWPRNQSLHRCDNPPCCNPKHLYGGTRRRNMLDMYERERHDRTHLNFRSNASGEKNPKAVLTQNIVDEIRVKYKAARASQEALGREYGVSQATISKILLNRTWTASVQADD